MLLLTVCLLGSACAAAENGRPAVERETDVLPIQSANASEQETPASLIFERDGKFGLLRQDGTVLVEAVYDSANPREAFVIFSKGSGEDCSWEIRRYDGTQIGTAYDSVAVWDWAGYCTLCRTDGVRSGLVQSEDGLRRIGEIPNTQYWILLRDGTLLTEEPFDACLDFQGEPYGEVYCIRDGWGYRYRVSAGDGSFLQDGTDEPGPQKERYFGYSLIEYRWQSREPCYGIAAKDGTTIIEPLYERVEIPFPDRFLLFEGGASQGTTLGRCRVTDETGKTLCDSFHVVDYSVFDGRYLGIAVCYGEDAAFPCFDSVGSPMPKGSWLVDRNGSICSERFQRLTIGNDAHEWVYHAQSVNDVLYAEKPDGSEETFLVKDLLLETDIP